MIDQAVTFFAHSSGTGRFLPSGSNNSVIHSSDVIRAAHLAAHHSVAHSFVINQSKTGQPLGHSTVHQAPLIGCALVTEPLLARK